MTIVAERINELWAREIAIEPIAGVATKQQVDDLRAPLDELRSSSPYRNAAGEDDPELHTVIARVLARGATIAYAAGERETASVWLAAAVDLAADDPELVAQLEAAKRDPERYRMLNHGRYLFAHRRERAALRAWKNVARGSTDALAAAAKAELHAPRPIRTMPTLRRINGIGTGFYGARDRWDDQSYVTTQCFSVLWVPIIPMRAFRVRTASGGYTLTARERLSPFAKIARAVVLAVVVLGVSGSALSSYLNDPGRLARKRVEAAIASAHDGKPEPALARLDDTLRDDATRVSRDLARRAGATVIELTAGLVPSPFTADNVDQAGRVVSRYQQLPSEAQGGAAQDALLSALDGWIAAVEKTPEAKLALLRREAEVAEPGRRAGIAERISVTRLAFARASEQDDPLAALAVLVEDPKDAAAMSEATRVIAAIADKPSLLQDAGTEIDAWTASSAFERELGQRVADQRTAAAAGRDAAEADGVTRAKLEAMQKQRLWDQRVALALARMEADAGKLDAAAARLRAFGPPGLLVRDARLELAQIAVAQGKLDDADAIVSALLAARLPRYTAASSALEAAIQRLQERVRSDMDAGRTPEDLQSQLLGKSEDDQRTAFHEWLDNQIKSDPEITAAHTRYDAYSDVVPVAIFVGTVELRRAQTLGGAARDKMLDRAEKAFLAVRGAAEGRPEFNIGLGEIYARLGKTKESDAELQGVLDKNEPQLSLEVARVYRGLGRSERGKEVAKHVYETASSPDKEHAAGWLAIAYEDDVDESERWYQRADQTDAAVKIGLLETRGRRELAAGKLAECDRTFAEIARRDLAMANAANLAGYNNASVADNSRFQCSGAPDALRDALGALEQAYKAAGEDPIVVGNLTTMLETAALARALGKRVDLHALHATTGDVDRLADVLLDSSERDAVLADLAADPAWRRAAEIASHFEVLAPSRPAAYQLELTRAYRLRDETVMTAVVERMRRAKLDTSDDDEAQQKWLAGTDDAKSHDDARAAVQRYTDVLDGGTLTGHARAAVLFLQSEKLAQLGVYWPDADATARAIAARSEAGKLWPALANESAIAYVLLDEAGIRADGKRWSKLRRERYGAAILAKLAADRDPLAAKILGSAEWAQVGAHMRADTSRPGLDDVRLARLLGDAQLEARVKTVFDDHLYKLSAESNVLASPKSAAPREDLDALSQR